jgi:hypothetical protein
METEKKGGDEKRNLTDKDVDAVAEATVGKIASIAGSVLVIFVILDFAQHPALWLENGARQLSEIAAFFHHLFSN